eukprot:33313_1
MAFIPKQRIMLIIIISIYVILLFSFENFLFPKPQFLDQEPLKQNTSTTIPTNVQPNSVPIPVTHKVELRSTVSRVAWCVPSLWTGNNFKLENLKQWETHYKELGVSSAFIYTVVGGPNSHSTSPETKEYLLNNPWWQVFANGDEHGTYHGQSWAIKHCFDQDRTIGEWLDNNYLDNGCVTLG